MGTRQRRLVFPVLPEKKWVEVGLGIGEEIRGAPELGGSPGRRCGAAPRRVLLPPGSDFSPRCRLCGFQPVRVQERVDGSLRTKEAVRGAGEGSSCDPWGTPRTRQSPELEAGSGPPASLRLAVLSSTRGRPEPTCPRVLHSRNYISQAARGSRPPRLASACSDWSPQEGGDRRSPGRREALGASEAGRRVRPLLCSRES